jgi:hypothetical protein
VGKINMKHLKNIFESDKISEYKFERMYKSIQLIFAELVDADGVDIWKGSDEHNYDRTAGNFIKIHIPTPKCIWSVEDGESDKFNQYVEDMDKFNELLKDIQVGLKRMEEEFPDCYYVFDHINDCIEFIVLEKTPY